MVNDIVLIDRYVFGDPYSHREPTGVSDTGLNVS